MASLTCQMLRLNLKRLFRQSQPVRHKVGQGSYEGEGKTTMTILNRDADYGLMIDKISMQGFKLNLGVTVLGPMIIFPRTVIGWNITQVEDINHDSLTLFRILDPKPDIVVLGLDKTYPRGTKFIEQFESIMHGLGISCEVLNVDKACTTFNFLTAEKRYAVGAFLPPRSIDDLDWESLNEMAIRRWLEQDWDQTDPNEKHFTTPNSMDDVYFPSEENKKMIEDMKKRRAEKKLQNRIEQEKQQD